MPTAVVANPRRRYLTMASRSIAKPIALRTSSVAEDRIAQVQADVRVVGARRRGDLHAPFVAQLPHDVGRQVVDDEIDRALAQLEAAHRVVGNHLEHQRRRSRAAAVVLVEGVSTRRSSATNRASAVRPGADRLRARWRRPSRPARSPSPG